MDNQRQKHRGHYLGTEIDESWYRRYRKDGFFARGNGEYWIEDDGLYFRRYLTKKPLMVPFRLVKRIRLSSCHAGKWVIVKRVLKLVWEKDGQTLSSGFILARGKHDTLELKAELERKVAKA